MRTLPRATYNLPLFINAGPFGGGSVLAVVVGGGPVGLRKLADLQQAGCRVRVVTPELRPHHLGEGAVEWRSRTYAPEHIEDADLVIAAAPSDVSQRVFEDARRLGIWVCRADDARAGDFILPACLRRGRFQVAITTNGASPSLARRVRDRLAHMFDETFERWVALLAALREEAERRRAPKDQTRTFLDQISDWTWYERYREPGGPSVVRQAYEDLATEMLGPPRLGGVI